MKKNLLTLMLAMLSVTAWGQQEKGTWAAQLKVGLNVAGFTSYDFNYHNSGDAKADPRYAMHAGVEVEYQLTDRFGFVFGAQYSMQGDNEKLRDGSRMKMTNMFDYINVPILAKCYVAKRLALKAGIQPSFRVRSDYEITSPSPRLWFGTTGSFSDLGINVRDFDLAIPFGIAYELPSVNSNGIVLEARWNYGLLKVAKAYEGKSPRNLVFQFSLGYKFSL